MIGAFAAMAIPGPSGDATQIGSVLLVGALALLAGHAWGLLIVAVADALLVGTLWPVVVFADTESTRAIVAAYVALAGSVPGLVLLGRTLPRTVDMLVGRRSEKTRSAGVTACSFLIVVWIALPIL